MTILEVIGAFALFFIIVLALLVTMKSGVTISMESEDADGKKTRRVWGE